MGRIPLHNDGLENWTKLTCADTVAYTWYSTTNRNRITKWLPDTMYADAVIALTSDDTAKMKYRLTTKNCDNND